MDIKDIERQDKDLIENVVVALREIWNRKLIVFLVTIVGLLTGVIFISLKGVDTKYYTSTSLFSAVYGSTEDTTAGVTIMNRYADLIKSSRVCNRAAVKLTDMDITAHDLQNMVTSKQITVTGASNTAMNYGYTITIGVTANSKEEDLAIANAMASALATELNELIGTDTIQVMDEAISCSSYKTINVPLYILIFAGGAFLVTCMIIFVFGFFSPWAASVEQCEWDENLILGLLPYVKNEK